MTRLSRSLLFVPGDRPERFDKAAASGAHEIVLDLEDSVAPAAKAGARDAVARWLDGGRQVQAGLQVGVQAGVQVRVNGWQTPWFDDDLALLRTLPAATAMLPKADAESLAAVAAALPGRQVVALLETARGWRDLRALAALPNVARIAFGSVDFEAETGIADDGDALTPVRTQIVLESRAAGLAAPIDGVSLAFDDEDAMRRHALRARRFGFGGKLCIHPRQVAAVNGAWQPSAEERAWAERVLAAFQASGGGVTTVDGKMVDKPVVERARQIAAEAG
ncbi:MAG: CoA ester lyase [Proteobacteria bacterium]|nr:CoA ester lyase [Pseudomonadota bacterium]